jgi:hypothetical protein
MERAIAGARAAAILGESPGGPCKKLLSAGRAGCAGAAAVPISLTSFNHAIGKIAQTASW